MSPCPVIPAEAKPNGRLSHFIVVTGMARVCDRQDDK
tara:strand:- start:19966 stop:20076 length:111 start_codon:yes stop_codon:yes gene_type:complete